MCQLKLTTLYCIGACRKGGVRKGGGDCQSKVWPPPPPLVRSSNGCIFTIHNGFFLPYYLGISRRSGFEFIAGLPLNFADPGNRKCLLFVVFSFSGPVKPVV